MEETDEGMIYLSPEIEMDEDTESACTALLQQLSTETFAQAVQQQKLHAFPHIEMAEMLGQFAYTHERVMSIRSVLAETLEKNEKAGDLLCYASELVTAMESVGRQLNSVYYSCCQLAIDVTEDNDFISLMTETALQLTKDATTVNED